MWTKAFWLALLERAIKTFAQTLITVWATDEVTDVFEINWQQALGMAGFAALLSALTSIVSANVGNAGPSLATEATYTPTHAKED